MVSLTYVIDQQEFSRELADGEYIVGRSRSANVVIAEPSISGQHLRLQIANGVVTFSDLESRNGTMINGVRQTQGKILNGQTLRLGNVEVKFINSAQVENNRNNNNDDDFAPPPPPSPKSADNENYAVAQYNNAPNNVEVFEAPVVSGENPAKNRRLLLGAVAVVIIGLFVLVALPSNNKKDKVVAPTDVAENYWKNVKRGADNFTQNNYREAIAAWDAAEKIYETAKMDSDKVARNFANIAKPFAQAQNNETLDSKTNWQENRLLIKQMFDNNSLTSELNSFADALQRRCSLEQGMRAILSEAENLQAQKNFDAAAQKYREVSADSLYQAQASKAIKENERRRLKALSEEATAYATAKRFDRAIEIADEFFKRGGEDQKLQIELQRWRIEAQEQAMLKDVNETAKNATTAAEIAVALQKIAQLKATGTTANLSEVLTLEKELQERKYLVELETMYHQGNSDALTEHFKNALYSEQPQVREIKKRWEHLVTELKRADDAEQKGNFELALAAWNSVLNIEPDSKNDFHRRAKNKIQLYPPEVLGKNFLRRAEESLNEKKYRAARHLLKKAQEHGTNIDDLLKTLRSTGITLFNAGIVKFNAQEFSAAHEQINDAFDCFLPTDDFYKKVDDWMRRNEVKARNAKP